MLPFRGESAALIVNRPRGPARMFVRLPESLEQAAPEELADESDLLGTRRILRERRRRGKFEEERCDLCADDVACIEGFGYGSEPRCLHRRVDGKSVFGAQLGRQRPIAA